MITKLKDSGISDVSFLTSKNLYRLRIPCLSREISFMCEHARGLVDTLSSRRLSTSRVPVYYARTIISHSKCVESNTEKGLMPQ